VRRVDAIDTTPAPSPRPAPEPDSAGRRHARRAAPWLVFAALLALQVAMSRRLPDDWTLQASAGTAPPVTAVRLATLDEAALAGYLTALTIQGFDAQAGSLLPLRNADFTAIRAWLELSFALNPHSGYPLLLAAFDYSETAHAQDELLHPMLPAAPGMLAFVERSYVSDPAVHWRWMAHAAWVARFVLHDDARALRDAHLLRDAPESAGIPRWARELDSFVLHRKDARDARRALLGGLAAGGGRVDARELDLLGGRVASMSEREAANRAQIDRLIPAFPGAAPDDDHR
jgi:hypothetical protein